MGHKNLQHQPSGRDIKGDSRATVTSNRKNYDNESVYSQAHWSDFRRNLNDDESRYSQAHESDARTHREPHRSRSVRESTVRDSSHATIRVQDNKHESKHESKHSTHRPSTANTTKHDTPSKPRRAESVCLLSAAKDGHRSTHHDSRALLKKEESRHSAAAHNESSARHESHRESSHATSHHKHGGKHESKHESRHESTLKPSTTGVYGSTRHSSSYRDSRSKPESTLKPSDHGSSHRGSSRESTSNRRHGISNAPSRLASIKEEPSYGSDPTIKSSSKPTTHNPSRTRRTSWSISHKETSTALQSLVPSRSNHVANLDPRTADRLLHASRNQSLDGSEMEFLVDALAEGLIKPSEFAEFAAFARRKGFFDSGKGKQLGDSLGDWSDDENDDDDDNRKLRRADKGKRFAYYEEITVIHYQRIRRVTKK